MAKKSKFDSEAHAKALLARSLTEIKNAISIGILPKNPTRRFSVGERVQWGAHQEVYVREACEDGLYYLIESIGIVRDRDKPASNEFHYMSWVDIYPYNKAIPTAFAKKEDHYLRLSNSSIGSLLCMVYAEYSGVDFDVEYQRDHVWGLDDKVALIDSIFNNIDIGKFVFAQRSMSHRGKLYEIIDGKQRLTALCEFYEDRFPYKGYYFSQLSNADKDKFENHGVTYGQLENPSIKAIYETFIKLNTCGKPMASQHLNKVKKLLNELNK